MHHKKLTTMAATAMLKRAGKERERKRGHRVGGSRFLYNGWRKRRERGWVGEGSCAVKKQQCARRRRHPERKKNGGEIFRFFDDD